MTESNRGNLQTECKDQDGITTIRKEAWKLQEPLPSTSGNPPTRNFESNFSTPAEPSRQQITAGSPFQFQKDSPVQPTQYQPRNHYGATYGMSAPAQKTFSIAQGQNTHLGNYPIMVPIFCYPGCHQCQQFVNRYYY